MSALQQSRCLVLNKGWAPVGTVSLQRAIIMLFSEYENGEPKAKIIEHTTYQQFTWEDWSQIRPSADDEVIKGANIWFKIPEIILLTQYDRLPEPKIHFSRRNLFKRDQQTCQYCGAQPRSDELTIDHVVPKSQGGLSTWDNCVLACYKCNSYKANRTPEQAKMKLKKKPKKPRVSLFKWDSLKPVKSWCAFLGEAYWNVELENDMKDE